VIHGETEQINKVYDVADQEGAKPWSIPRKKLPGVCFSVFAKAKKGERAAPFFHG